MIRGNKSKNRIMKNPIGIDEKNPGLTWKCRDAIKQSAYKMNTMCKVLERNAKKQRLSEQIQILIEFQFEDNFKSRDIVNCRIRLTTRMVSRRSGASTQHLK